MRRLTICQCWVDTRTQRTGRVAGSAAGSAPLPPHMQQSFDALGFDADRFDVQDVDPEQ